MGSNAENKYNELVCMGNYHKTKGKMHTSHAGGDR
jgi:hypothetical protein